MRNIISDIYGYYYVFEVHTVILNNYHRGLCKYNCVLLVPLKIIE